MQALVREFFSRHPTLSIGMLGSAQNESALDLNPFGEKARFFAAEQYPLLVERYKAANAYAFPGELALPGWVLSDLYLLPGAIGLLLCPASELKPALRKRLELTSEDEAIAAAYLAAPTVHPGLFIGVSLISLIPGIHAGAWIKTLTLKMLRATRMRGVAQWANPSVRVHTRMGPMKVIGSVPGTHEFRNRSFVYETDLSDDVSWTHAMNRKTMVEPTLRIPSHDIEQLSKILQRAENGESIHIVPPGLDASDCVLLRMSHA